MTGGHVVHYQSMSGDKLVADYTPPFRRIDLLPELEASLQESLPAADQLHTPEAAKQLKDLCDRHQLACQLPHTAARLLDKLVGNFLEGQCVSPTFLINHPEVMSPLSKE